MKPIHVAAAAIEDQQGRILLSRRPDHVHQGGLWEFPGGKLESDETVTQGLARELAEELGIQLLRSEPLIQITHQYADRQVLLDMHRVLRFSGTPVGLEGQPLRWLFPHEMDPADFPAADRPVITALQLPDQLLITGSDPMHATQFLQRLQRALENGLRMVLLRAHELPDHDYALLAEAALSLCRPFKAQLIISRPIDIGAWQGMAQGIHLTRHQLMSVKDGFDYKCWVGASCHNPTELAQAIRLNLDYVLLSPVLHTRSHPDVTPLGWNRFAAWVERVNLPVYALGGVGLSELALAKSHGAQGVAAISRFWPET